MNLAIEFHDSTVEAVRTAGRDAVLEMTVYVHGSAGRPGFDPGTGWYQPADLVLSGAVIGDRVPAPPLQLEDGTVTLGGERLDGCVPLPFDRTGEVQIELSAVEGTWRARGSRLRVVLRGTPGEIEEFEGV